MVFLEQTAHFPMFERNAPCFFDLVSEWLTGPALLEEKLGGTVGSACAVSATSR